MLIYLRHIVDMAKVRTNKTLQFSCDYRKQAKKGISEAKITTISQKILARKTS